MTALLTLRFLDELLVGFWDAVFSLARASAEGAELHDVDVPLPLSGELFWGSFVICSLGRFLLLLPLRLEDELLRFLVALERFGFASFRRLLEDFREVAGARRGCFRVTSEIKSLSLSLPELELALELQPLDDGVLSESEVELSSLLSALLLPDGVACRRLVAFRLRVAAGAWVRMLNLTSS